MGSVVCKDLGAGKLYSKRWTCCFSSLCEVLTKTEKQLGGWVTQVGAAGDLVASLGSCFGSEKGGVESEAQSESNVNIKSFQWKGWWLHQVLVAHPHLPKVVAFPSSCITYLAGGGRLLTALAGEGNVSAVEILLHH